MAEATASAAEPFAWTELRVAILRERWPDTSWSAARIGEELGCTRNTVLGKAHRLNLGKRRVAPKAAPHVPPKRRPVPSPDAQVYCGAPVVRTVRNGRPHLTSWCACHLERVAETREQRRRVA